MPDLGPYAFYVLSSYGVTLSLLAAIVAVSLRRSARVARQLEAIEARVKGSSK
ncbi:MAG: heme exporter protein CcmD [Rubricella sp.]